MDQKDQWTEIHDQGQGRKIKCALWLRDSRSPGVVSFFLPAPTAPAKVHTGRTFGGQQLCAIETRKLRSRRMSACRDCRAAAVHRSITAMSLQSPGNPAVCLLSLATDICSAPGHFPPPALRAVSSSPLSLPLPQPPPALPSESRQAQAQQKVPSYLQSQHLSLPSPAHPGAVNAETSTSAWGLTLPDFSGSGDPACLQVLLHLGRHYGSGSLPS